jgi:hypothetical protein
MEDMEPKELSYVIVPSDRYANTVRIYKPQDISAKESYNEGGNDADMGIFDNIDLPLTEPEVQEAVNEEIVQVEAEVEVKEASDEKQQEVEVKEEEVVLEEEPQVVEEEPKQEKEEEPVEEESKEKSIDDMSKEELADKCKELMKQVSGLLEDVKYLKGKLDKERGFKEALELEVLQMKQVQKMHLAEQIVSLRKELGLREESMDDLMLLSEESLNSSIKTFMEFKESNTFNVNTLPKIESKALVDEEMDNTIKESAKDDLNKNTSNIDYEQQINSWLRNMTNKKFF